MMQSEILDLLCPMHLSVSQTGHISHCGPALQKLRDKDLIGQRFLEVFEVKRPRRISVFSDLKGRRGEKLDLQFRNDPRTGFKGIMVPTTHGGTLINLSFGISVVDAVRDYDLTSTDFAYTDLTIEMLFLAEAKSAAMDAARSLNQRLQGAKIAAEEQAFTDTLTGLKNRRALDHVLKRHADWDTHFALMHVDLDWFKAVNDNLGHAAGDHVLQVCARILIDETRDCDTVARVGGDEFTLVFPKQLDAHAMRSIGKRIVDRFSEPIPFEGNQCRISASIGTAFYEPGAGVSISQVLENADVALYASKRGGRAQQTLYYPGLSLADLPKAAGRDG